MLGDGRTDVVEADEAGGGLERAVLQHQLLGGEQLRWFGLVGNWALGMRIRGGGGV